MRYLVGIISLFIVSVALHAQEQRILNVEEDTEGGIGIYPCGERHEAMVQFVTSESFPLEFRSNYDPDLKVEVDSVAGKKTYSIVFITQAPGVSYDGRRLTILVPGFRNHVMTLNLRDKQKFIYIVSDPYSALRSPYFVYLEKGNEQFYNGQYQAAKDSYQMVRVCPEYQSNRENIDSRIAICDSMVVWSGAAKRMEQFAQFNAAAEYYYMMYYYNSGNKEISSQISHCQRQYVEDCENEYLLAEHYLDNNQVELARAAYQRVIDKKCSVRMEEAMASLSNLNRHDAKVAQHARCFFYEYNPNMPIGLTYAQCFSSEHVSSMYISAHMNKQLFTSFRGKASVKGSLQGSWETSSNQTFKNALYNNLESGALKFVYEDNYTEMVKGKYAPDKLSQEASLMFGWTIRTVPFLYLHLGIGYHGGGFCAFDNDAASKAISDWAEDRPLFDFENTAFNSWPEKLRDDCMENYWFNGASVEGGVIAKVWRLNLKLTYQYTAWFNASSYTELLDDNAGRCYIGFGFNW